MVQHSLQAVAKQEGKIMSKREMIKCLMLSPFYFDFTLEERKDLVNKCLSLETTFKKVSFNLPPLS